VVMRRRTTTKAAVMMLIRREMTEELQQDHIRKVRLGGGLVVSAFSRKASSSPCTDVSSDELAS
jgi:hypothetical protein